MQYSFGKDKMVPLKAIMVLIIIADHLALFYGVEWLRLFIELGAPVVSVFFFISGYGLHVSYGKRGEEYLASFFRLRFWKVLAPWLLATILYAIFLWRPEEGFLDALKAFVNKGIVILPFSWFAVEILVFYVCFYLVYKFIPQKWRLVVLWLATIILMICAIEAGYDRCWWVSTLAFPAGLSFAMAEKSLYASFNNRPVRYWLLLLSLIVIFGIAYYPRQPYLWTLCYVCIPMIVALIVSALPLQRLSSGVVVFLATISYEVYLCQGMAMELLRTCLNNDTLFVLSAYVLTIALAWLLHFLSGLITRR